MNTRHQVRRVLIVTLALNITVAVGKIVVGALTGAVSITADGFHSLMDGSSNLIGLGANVIAGKPADDDHPYGHRRYETLAALAVGILLVFTAYEIVTSALDRLISGERPEVSPLTFAVLTGTLIVNLFVSRYERREGLRLRSELLIADAANTGADVFVTLSVLASMALVALFGWTWADPVAALIIVVLIGRAAWQIIKQTGGVLVDTAPYKPGDLAAFAEEVPVVKRVLRARSRGTPDAALIDIDVEVAPGTTAEQTAAISDAISEKLCAHLTGVDEVEVHFQPTGYAERDYAQTARARADALGLNTHEVRLIEGAGSKVMELHVEVPPGQTLEQAHGQVTELEGAIRAALPDLTDVVTHIEPKLTEVGGDLSGTAAGVRQHALALLRVRFPAVDWHDLRVSALNGSGFYALTLHAALTASITVEEAHDLAERAEVVLRSELPRVARVTIHTEPRDS
jgi:cation diffusion facilitator family transporter